MNQTHSMYIVDSHCHLNFEDLKQNLDSVMATAEALKVRSMLCVAVDMENFPDILALARQLPGVSASVGVHPNVTEGHDPSADELVSLASDENVVAIGETGLDYFRSEGKLDWQHDRFARHIDAARRTQLPLIIHTRAAAPDTLAMLREHKAEDAGGTIHCFAEDWDFACAAMDLGFYISFSGIVTFKSATAIQDVARRMPLERMLVETDSPYLAPLPYRGKTNQPGYTRHVVEFIAALRNISVEEIAAQTTDNYFELFDRAIRQA